MEEKPVRRTYEDMDGIITGEAIDHYNYAPMNLKPYTSVFVTYILPLIMLLMKRLREDSPLKPIFNTLNIFPG